MPAASWTQFAEAYPQTTDAAKRRAISGLKYFRRSRSVPQPSGNRDMAKTASAERAEPAEARRLLDQCRWRARHHRRAGALAGGLAGQSHRRADRRPRRAGIRPADRALARLRRQEQGARVVVRDLHLGGGAGRRDRADRPVHDRARAAGASALCGQGAGDGRPHQPGPRRARTSSAAGTRRNSACSARRWSRRATTRRPNGSTSSNGFTPPTSRSTMTAPTTASRKPSAGRPACSTRGR